MTVEVKKITALETIPLRQAVLRPGRPRSEAIFSGDDDSSTFHVGVFVDGACVTVSTFMQESLPEVEPSLVGYRLRGMATDPSFQGQGLGKKALLFAIEELRLRECFFLWCHARQNAFRFYESLDFQFHGPLFEIPVTGPHKVMYKYLITR